MINNKTFLAVIPARYSSTRLPGKVLLDIHGKSLIQRVYERVKCCKAVQEVVIALDDERVARHVESFGAKWTMTSSDHPSGTDRCAEVSARYPEFSHIINVQGDEPFIDPSNIQQLTELLGQTGHTIVSLMCRLQHTEDFFNPNVVKVVVNQNHSALYFSRSPIPHQRSRSTDEYQLNDSSFRHLGLYGFERKTLEKITQLSVGKLEQLEMLEQLRWLENAYSIHMGITDSVSFGVDVEADLYKAIEQAKKMESDRNSSLQ